MVWAVTILGRMSQIWFCLFNTAFRKFYSPSFLPSILLHNSAYFWHTACGLPCFIKSLKLASWQFGNKSCNCLFNNTAILSYLTPKIIVTPWVPVTCSEMIIIICSLTWNKIFWWGWQGQLIPFYFPEALNDFDCITCDSLLFWRNPYLMVPCHLEATKWVLLCLIHR